jgi:ankyrin repeat protein
MRSLFRLKLSIPARITGLLILGIVIGMLGSPLWYRSLLSARLFEAATAGDNDQALILINRGADVNAQDEYGDTPLMYAARNGHSQTAMLLLSSGADVNVRDAYGVTAALWADNHKYEYRILSWEYGGEVRKIVRSEYRETLTLLKNSGAQL